MFSYEMAFVDRKGVGCSAQNCLCLLYLQKLEYAVPASYVPFYQCSDTYALGIICFVSVALPFWRVMFLFQYSKLPYIYIYIYM